MLKCYDVMETYRYNKTGFHCYVVARKVLLRRNGNWFSKLLCRREKFSTVQLPLFCEWLSGSQTFVVRISELTSDQCLWQVSRNPIDEPQIRNPSDVGWQKHYWNICCSSLDIPDFHLNASCFCLVSPIGFSAGLRLKIQVDCKKVQVQKLKILVSSLFCETLHYLKVLLQLSLMTRFTSALRHSSSFIVVLLL